MSCKKQEERKKQEELEEKKKQEKRRMLEEKMRETERRLSIEESNEKEKRQKEEVSVKERDEKNRKWMEQLTKEREQMEMKSLLSNPLLDDPSKRVQILGEIVKHWWTNIVHETPGLRCKIMDQKKHLLDGVYEKFSDTKSAVTEAVYCFITDKTFRSFDATGWLFHYLASKDPSFFTIEKLEAVEPKMYNSSFFETMPQVYSHYIHKGELTTWLIEKTWGEYIVPTLLKIILQGDAAARTDPRLYGITINLRYCWREAILRLINNNYDLDLLISKLDEIAKFGGDLRTLGNIVIALSKHGKPDLDLIKKLECFYEYQGHPNNYDHKPDADTLKPIISSIFNVHSGKENDVACILLGLWHRQVAPMLRASSWKLSDQAYLEGLFDIICKRGRIDRDTHSHAITVWQAIQSGIKFNSAMRDHSGFGCM